MATPRKSDLCGYCGEVDAQPPYRFLRDGIPSATTISGLLDMGMGKSSSFGWAASLICATTAVHERDRWDALSTESCTHEKTGLCGACKFLRAEFQMQWDAKANLGSHVHHLALSWAEGQQIETTPDIDPYMDAVASFYEERKPSWVLTERTVRGQCDGLAYRGKFDGIADIDCPVEGHDRCRWLLDYKTGRYYPVEQTIQLTGYARADLTEWDGKIETTVGPVPRVDHCGVVLLAPSVSEDGEMVGSYDLHELPVSDETWDLFSRLRFAFDAVKRLEKWANAEEKFREKETVSV